MEREDRGGSGTDARPEVPDDPHVPADAHAAARTASDSDGGDSDSEPRAASEGGDSASWADDVSQVPDDVPAPAGARAAASSRTASFGGDSEPRAASDSGDAASLADDGSEVVDLRSSQPSLPCGDGGIVREHSSQHRRNAADEPRRSGSLPGKEAAPGRVPAASPGAASSCGTPPRSGALASLGSPLLGAIFGSARSAEAPSASPRPGRRSAEPADGRTSKVSIEMQDLSASAGVVVRTVVARADSGGGGAGPCTEKGPGKRRDSTGAVPFDFSSRPPPPAGKDKKKGKKTERSPRPEEKYTPSRTPAGWTDWLSQSPQSAIAVGCLACVLLGGSLWLCTREAAAGAATRSCAEEAQATGKCPLDCACVRFLHINDIYNLEEGRSTKLGELVEVNRLDVKEETRRSISTLTSEEDGLVGGFENLAERFVEERKKAVDAGFQVIVTLGGDFLSPNVRSQLFTNGLHMVEAANELGIDLAVWGNHEVDFGLAAAYRLMRCSRFPWLSANLLEGAGPEAKFVPGRTKFHKDGERILVDQQGNAKEWMKLKAVEVGDQAFPVENLSVDGKGALVIKDGGEIKGLDNGAVLKLHVPPLGGEQLGSASEARHVQPSKDTPVGAQHYGSTKSEGNLPASQRLGSPIPEGKEFAYNPENGIFEIDVGLGSVKAKICFVGLTTHEVDSDKFRAAWKKGAAQSLEKVLKIVPQDDSDWRPNGFPFENPTRVDELIKQCPGSHYVGEVYGNNTAIRESGHKKASRDWHVVWKNVLASKAVEACTTVIPMTHLSWEEDVHLLKSLTSERDRSLVRLLMGGHDHEPYVYREGGAAGFPERLGFKVGMDAQYYGRVDMFFRAGKANVRGSKQAASHVDSLHFPEDLSKGVLPVERRQAGAQVLQAAAAARKRMQSLKLSFDTLIQELVTKTIMPKWEGLYDTLNVRSRETRAAEFWADVLRAYTAETFPQVDPKWKERTGFAKEPILGFMNSGGIRGGVLQTDHPHNRAFTELELRNDFPFPDVLAIWRMSAQELLVGMLHFVADWGEGNFPVVSGLQFEVSHPKAAAAPALAGDRLDNAQRPSFSIGVEDPRLFARRLQQQLPRNARVIVAGPEFVMKKWQKVVREAYQEYEKAQSPSDAVKKLLKEPEFENLYTPWQKTNSKEWRLDKALEAQLRGKSVEDVDRISAMRSSRTYAPDGECGAVSDRGLEAKSVLATVPEPLDVPADAGPAASAAPEQRVVAGAPIAGVGTRAWQERFAAAQKAEQAKTCLRTRQFAEVDEELQKLARPAADEKRRAKLLRTALDVGQWLGEAEEFLKKPEASVDEVARLVAETVDFNGWWSGKPRSSEFAKAIQNSCPST